MSVIFAYLTPKKKKKRKENTTLCDNLGTKLWGTKTDLIKDKCRNT